MRRSAYVLLADPSFLGASLRAYYDHVDRIVLSYDESATSWTGTPLPVDECLAIVKEIDVDGKCVAAPGHYARLEHPPLDNDTYQRQAALDEASDDADWVLQLDTDEVILDPDSFLAALTKADDAGAGGLHYPSRWLYSRVAPGRYLEASTRWGRPVASYPGPLAVRAGTRLDQARQADVPLYRVDLRPWNTDPAHHHTTIVHDVVTPQEAVLHFSWVRSDDVIRRKFGWSGHTDDYSRPAVYRTWRNRSRRPHRTALTSPLRRTDWYRLVTVPEPPGGEP
ncbi:hypothetical protein [Oerskovia flava]|uniref:hypothetical protein n=1 Tax=Oerskovia flava TaxID=2986422 RepID=UPI00223FB44B|nr:hypothetical protein [Oerskovia sp. JB1-3-2]